VSGLYQRNIVSVDGWGLVHENQPRNQGLDRGPLQHIGSSSITACRREYYSKFRVRSGRPVFACRRSLQRQEESNEGNRKNPPVPGPYYEYLGRVGNKTYEKEDDIDDQTPQKSSHGRKKEGDGVDMTHGQIQHFLYATIFSGCSRETPRPHLSLELHRSTPKSYTACGRSPRPAWYNLSLYFYPVSQPCAVQKTGNSHAPGGNGPLSPRRPRIYPGIDDSSTYTPDIDAIAATAAAGSLSSRLARETIQRAKEQQGGEPQVWASSLWIFCPD
jgi:hypothetical protein